MPSGGLGGRPVGRSAGPAVTAGVGTQTCRIGRLDAPLPYSRNVSADVWIGAVTTLDGGLPGGAISVVLGRQQAREARLRAANDASAPVFLVVESDGIYQGCREVLRSLWRAPAVSPARKARCPRDR